MNKENKKQVKLKIITRYFTNSFIFMSFMLSVNSYNHYYYYYLFYYYFIISLICISPFCLQLVTQFVELIVFSLL